MPGSSELGLCFDRAPDAIPGVGLVFEPPIAQRPPAAAQQRRRRLLAGLGAAALAAFAIGVAAGAGDEGRPAPVDEPGSAAPPVVELPGGGTTILPGRRVVALYGAPQDAELGELGIGTPDEAGRKLLDQARPYDSRTQPVLPAMELIATIAAAEGGERGDHALRQPKRTIRTYLAAARRHDALLILDIQPGYADFLAEARRLEEFLVEPDVGLALDPEWKVRPPELPGQVIGSVDAAEVNEVSAYLDRLVAEHGLPQKLLVIHQFTEDMIARRELLRDRRGLAIVLNSDGFGDVPNKRAKYDELRPRGPTGDFHEGFKLFYREDFPLMTPEQVLDLRPEPELVIYE